MTDTLSFRKGAADPAQLAAHLKACDAAFVTPLSGRVDIGEYAQKIVDHADRFEAWGRGELIGLVAVYCDQRDGGRAFVTNVSVLPAWHGRGIASRLMRQCIEAIRLRGITIIELEVESDNDRAIALYSRDGFTFQRSAGGSAIMKLRLEKT